jgi:hypothetical protein
MVEKTDLYPELKLIKLVSSNYKVLKTLFPYKKLSFSDLSKHIDRGHLSRSKDNMEKNGLINIIVEYSNSGKKTTFFELSLIGRKIVNFFSNLYGVQVSMDTYNEEHMANALALISKEKTRSLALDQIQLISRKSTIPPLSVFFRFIQGNLASMKEEQTRVVLLLTIQNILRNPETRIAAIISKIEAPILHIADEYQSERSGKEAKRIIENFFIEHTYESLKEQYLIALTIDQPVVFLRNLLLEKYPENKVDIRNELLTLLETAEGNLDDVIKNEFTQFY